jgi:hypothetical protein
MQRLTFTPIESTKNPARHDVYSPAPAEGRLQLAAHSFNKFLLADIYGV